MNVQSGVQLKTFEGKKYYIIVPEGATENMPLIVYFPGANPSDAFNNYQKNIANQVPTKAVLNGSAYNYQKFIYSISNRINYLLAKITSFY